MWIKRSDSQIAEFHALKTRKRKSLVRPIIHGAIWGSLVTTAYYLGFRGGGRGYYLIAQNSRFTASTAIMGIFAFVAVAGVVYYYQMRGMTFFESHDTWLCSKCYEPGSTNPENICSCGGRLEPYEYYLWQEDKSNEHALLDMSLRA